MGWNQPAEKKTPWNALNLANFTHDATTRTADSKIRNSPQHLKAENGRTKHTESWGGNLRGWVFRKRWLNYSDSDTGRIVLWWREYKKAWKNLLMVHVDGEVRIMMIFVIKCDASSDQIKLWKNVGMIEFCVCGNELWLGTLMNWGSGRSLLLFVCYVFVEIYLWWRTLRGWEGQWSLRLCVYLRCVCCVRGNLFEFEGAEEADEVAAAGGERLPDAAGLQVFQVKVVQVFQVNCPPL